MTSFLDGLTNIFKSNNSSENDYANYATYASGATYTLGSQQQQSMYEMQNQIMEAYRELPPIYPQLYNMQMGRAPAKKKEKQGKPGSVPVSEMIPMTQTGERTSFWVERFLKENKPQSKKKQNSRTTTSGLLTPEDFLRMRDLFTPGRIIPARTANQLWYTNGTHSGGYYTTSTT